MAKGDVQQSRQLLTVQIRPMRALYGSSSTRAVLLNSLKKKYISSLTLLEDGIMAAPANCGSGDETVHFSFVQPPGSLSLKVHIITH